jgi:cold shock CspA family protein
MNTATRIQGFVKTWKTNGWGFIYAQDGEDYFVHYKSLCDRRSLIPDQLVEFTGIPGSKGRPEARDVRVVEEINKKENLTSE